MTCICFLVSKKTYCWTFIIKSPLLVAWHTSATKATPFKHFVLLTIYWSVRTRVVVPLSMIWNRCNFKQRNTTPKNTTCLSFHHVLSNYLNKRYFLTEQNNKTTKYKSILKNTKWPTQTKQSAQICFYLFKNVRCKKLKCFFVNQTFFKAEVWYIVYVILNYTIGWCNLQVYLYKHPVNVSCSS